MKQTLFLLSLLQVLLLRRAARVESFCVLGDDRHAAITRRSHQGAECSFILFASSSSVNGDKSSASEDKQHDLPSSTTTTTRCHAEQSNDQCTAAKKKQLPYAARDSQAQLEADVTRVVRDVRPWADDPTVPKYFSAKKLSFTNYWNLNDWERHNSRWRFVRYIRGLPTSRLLRRVIPQWSALVVWSLLAVAMHDYSSYFRNVNVPLSALTLISTFVAALLTLRSNQGLTRLQMGREAMGMSVLLTRDAAALFSTYVYPKDEILGLKAARLLSLFGWTLKSHIRETGAKDVIRTLLPQRSMDASYRYVTTQRKPPVALLNMLRQIMYDMSERQIIGTTEHRLIEQSITGLDNVVMTAERIRATPIPPIYSAHATRLMMFYLASLPFALLGLDLSNTASVFLTTVVGFAMLGLDEISHVFEQPFRFMPLYQLAKVSMLDVADAFVCRPPPLSADEIMQNDDSRDDKLRIEEMEDQPEPTYWDLNGSIAYDRAVGR